MKQYIQKTFVLLISIIMLFSVINIVAADGGSGGGAAGGGPSGSSSGGNGGGAAEGGPSAANGGGAAEGGPSAANGGGAAEGGPSVANGGGAAEGGPSGDDPGPDGGGPAEPLNTPPSISGIPDVTILQNSGLNSNILNLWAYATDAESGASGLTYSIVSQSNTALVSCSISANRYVSCTTMNPAGFGQSIVVVQVSDGEYRNTDSFNVNVLRVNQPPSISGLPDVTLIEDSGFNDNVITNLRAYSSDVDTPLSQLTFRIVSQVGTTLSNLPPPWLNIPVVTDIVNCVIDANANIDCTTFPDAFGTTVVTVEVSDGEHTDTDSFNVIVLNVNDAPVMALPDVFLNTNSGYNNDVMDLWEHTFDSDNAFSELTFTILSQTNTALVDCLVDSNRYIDCIVTDNMTGFSDVTVQVTDGEFNVTDDFRVHVADYVNGTAVIITYPNGGEVLRGTIDVTWWAVSVAGNPLLMDLEYSLNSGISWTTIAAGIPNTGVYPWNTVGYPDQTGYLLRLWAHDTVTGSSAFDITDGTFTVNNIVPVIKEDRPRRGIHISTITFLNPDGEFVSVGEEVIMRVSIANDGDLNLEGISITAVSQELALRSRAGPFDLRRNAEETKTLFFRVPDYAAPGDYPLRFTIDSEDGVKRVVYRFLTIR